MSKRRYRWKRIFGLVFTLAVIGIGSAPFLWVSDGRVIPGVTIHGTKAGGATEEELKELFSVKNADLLHGKLVLIKEDAHEEISFRSLSVRYDGKAIEKAMALGRTGGLFQRWYDRWRILLTGHGLGGELFFVGRAAQVGGRLLMRSTSPRISPSWPPSMRSLLSMRSPGLGKTDPFPSMKAGLP